MKEKLLAHNLLPGDKILWKSTFYPVLAYNAARCSVTLRINGSAIEKYLAPYCTVQVENE